MENNKTSKSETKKLGLSMPLIGIGIVAILGLGLGFYGLSTRKKVKFYNHNVLEKQILKAVYKKAESHTRGLYDEIVHLSDQLQKDQEAYKANQTLKLKSKIEKKEERMRNKIEAFQRLSSNTIVTLMEEMIKEKLPKALEQVRTRQRCAAIVPITGKLALRGEGPSIYNASYFGDLDIANCIDPKSDVTEDILKELGLELEDEKKDKTTAQKEGKSNKNSSQNNTSTSQEGEK